MRHQLFPAAAAIAALAAADGAATAAPVSVGFTNISNNGGLDLSGQLDLTVSEGAGTVDFTFMNLVGIGSSVMEIYLSETIDDYVAESSLSQEGASFSFGDVKPGHLPGTNKGGWSKSLSADAQSHGGDNGQNGGESGDGLDTADDWVTLHLELANGWSYQDIVSALADETFFFGLHIHSIEGGGANDSDAYLSTPPSTTTIVVPLPAVPAMAAVGIVAVMPRRRRSA